MKIIVCGDTHGNWRYLNTLINTKNPDIILQCGDFGYWPSMEEVPYEDHGYYRKKNKYKVCGMKNPNTKIYWCDGNHEEFSKLNEVKDNEICPNVFYMKRGSTLTLPDKRVVLFMGGGDSIDKNLRTPGYDWFPEELISQRDIYNLPDVKVDIIISHTCPTEFKVEGDSEKYNDPSRKALSVLLKKYRPSLWYFAHWHLFKEGFDEGTKWTCLNMAGETHWWKYLLK